MQCIYISRDRRSINAEEVAELLHKSDWAAKRSLEDISKTVENSMCYGLFDANDKLIGFARVITDFVTTFYLMDVIIDELCRGQGFGKMLMNAIMDDVGHLYGILHTDTAQRFYEPYGFKTTATAATGESIMEKPRNINIEESGR